MKLKQILIKTIAVGMLFCALFLTACDSATQATLKKLTSTSQSIYNNAESVSNTDAPTYGQPTSTQNTSNALLTTITTKSAEMIVKLGNIGLNLQTLSATITEFKSISKQITDKNIDVSIDDLNTLNNITSNLKTINNGVNEKKTALQQEVATINTNIQSYIQNPENLTAESVITSVNQAYTRAYNAIDYVSTKVSEVNTLLLSAIETLKSYTTNQEVA